MSENETLEDLVARFPQEVEIFPLLLDAIFDCDFIKADRLMNSVPASHRSQLREALSFQLKQTATLAVATRKKWVELSRAFSDLSGDPKWDEQQAEFLSKMSDACLRLDPEALADAEDVLAQMKEQP